MKFILVVLLTLCMFVSYGQDTKSVASEKVGGKFKVAVTTQQKDGTAFTTKTVALDSSVYTDFVLAMVEELDTLIAVYQKHIDASQALRTSYIASLTGDLGATAYTGALKKKLQAFLQGIWEIEETSGGVPTIYTATITGLQVTNGGKSGTLTIVDNKNCTLTGFFTSPLNLKLTGNQLSGKIGSVNYVVRKPNAALANSQPK